MKMNETAPSLVQWQKLMDRTMAFRQLAPWEWMTDDILFGVQHPKTGETGWCCVIGNLGELYGLIVFRGAAGLASYRKLYAAEAPEYNFDVFLSQDCLKLTFDDRDETEKEDREIYQSLKMKLRGRNAYPVFRNMSPGYYPWFISATDADVLSVALEQSAEVCMRYKGDKTLLHAPAPGRYFARVPESRDGVITWQDAWVEPEPAPAAPVVDAFGDDLRLQRIKSNAKRTAASWEFDYAYADAPVQEQKADRPFFPLLLLIADRETGLILDSTVAAPHAYRTDFVEGFLRAVEKISTLPAEVHVVRSEAAAMLEPILSRLKVKLATVKKCPEIEKARKAFGRFTGGR